MSIESIDSLREKTFGAETSSQPLYYVLVMWGDVEPEIFGPFATPDDRDDEARALKADHGDEDGIYWLTTQNNLPEIGAYSGAFFSGEPVSDEDSHDD